MSDPIITDPAPLDPAADLPVDVMADLTLDEVRATLAPGIAANAAFDGLAAGRFLILPHPQVAEYARRRAEDPERWLTGMARLRRSMRVGA